jgi:hypothetical protein
VTRRLGLLPAEVEGACQGHEGTGNAEAVTARAAKGHPLQASCRPYIRQPANPMPLLRIILRAICRLAFSLQAWQPILTPKWVVCVFLLIGIPFIIIGFVCKAASDSVGERIHRPALDCRAAQHRLR